MFCFIVFLGSFIRSSSYLKGKYTIALKDSPELKVSMNSNTVRLKSISDVASDDSVKVKFTQDGDMYQIFFGDTQLCLGKSGPGITGCSGDTSGKSKWKVENGPKGIFLKVLDKCLTKRSMDNRPSSKGFYMQATNCQNSSDQIFIISEVFDSKATKTPPPPADDSEDDDDDEDSKTKFIRAKSYPKPYCFLQIK